ncbi:CIA30 family protein [Shewanella sp. 10N.286.52.A9]|uniref:CIA30 family protein n=1 Tax=Shewanella sp. 10N.286.52.A9 TaxID=3229711 RepID=UPI00354E5F97
MIGLSIKSNQHFTSSGGLFALVVKCLFAIAVYGFLLSSFGSRAMEIQFASSDKLTPARISNDSVMGGISSSQIEINHSATTKADINSSGHVHFSGQVSLENNGGFASMEYQITSSIPATKQVKLTVLGDGKQYQLRFKTSELSFGEAYVANFETTKGQVTEHLFSQTDFTAQFRGRSINAPTIEFNNVNRVGFLIANKQAGAFSLQLDSIEFEEHD